MPEAVAAAVMAYIGTNIDDMFINLFFFAQADGKHGKGIVYLGKYAVIILLFAVSWLASCGLQIIPQEYIRWLGIVPILLGIRAVFDRDNDSKNHGSKSLLWNVILVTLANSADNIGVYIPLFTGYTLSQMAVVLAVFLLMTALWCFCGQKLANLPFLRQFLLKHKRWIVPAVLITLGIYILI